MTASQTIEASEGTLTTMRMVRLQRCCVIVLCFFLFSFQQCGSAWLFSCSVAQHDDRTTYNIVRHSPDGPPVSADKAFDCEYTWANASQHVMAHNLAQAPELVLTNSINTLITSKCIDKVVYTRICVSEGEHYTANCTISCHGGDKDFLPYLIAFIIILLVVLVVGLLVFLWCRYKIRVPSSDQSTPKYCLVQKDVDSKAADVESEGSGRCFI